MYLQDIVGHARSAYFIGQALKRFSLQTLMGFENTHRHFLDPRFMETSLQTISF